MHKCNRPGLEVNHAAREAFSLNNSPEDGEVECTHCKIRFDVRTGS